MLRRQRSRERTLSALESDCAIFWLCPTTKSLERTALQLFGTIVDTKVRLLRAALRAYEFVEQPALALECGSLSE